MMWIVGNVNEHCVKMHVKRQIKKRSVKSFVNKTEHTQTLYFRHCGDQLDPITSFFKN